MDPLPRELCGGMLEKYDRVYRFDIPIAKFLAFFAVDPLILPQEMVGGISGAALAGKSVPDLLYFHIAQAPVLHLDHDVGVEQGRFRTEAYGVIRERF